MQKKSLLVALFCGALCLTGCIKNEESASVAQVRIAKANELNSIADLNKAKAAAEAVYAQAELTLAQAEAELKKAEAAVKNAEAATEKVRAELLAVQVKLAEVKVEEEKVKLQMMEADLEARLAALEAEKAAAAAAKQAWVNVLDQLLAENEIAAIENAHAIYEAQAQLDSCILATEGAKADSAKVYAALYFQALDTVAKLQTQVIEAKVSRVLIERGAMDTRDYIYQQIDAKNEQIEENNARIAELKKYQTMDAEEAQAKLEEARLAMNEAYNAYKDASDAREALADALNGNTTKQITGLKNMTPDYTDDWKGVFKDEFKTYVTGRGASKVYYGDHKDVNGVQYYGVFVADDDKDATNNAFIPLWTSLKKNNVYYNWADVKTTDERYPNIDVYEGENKDFIELTNTTYVPAKIEFDNVKEVLDGLVAEKKDAIAADNKKYEEETIPAQIEEADAEIAVINDTLSLHKAYVDEREPGVTEAEEAYFEALEADSLLKQSQKDAWNAFQNYMLKKYSNVSRAAFELRWEMQDSAAVAASDTVNANADLAAAKEGVTLLEGKLASAIEAEAKAEGAYRRAYEEWSHDEDIAEIIANWEDWQTYYNPKFDYNGKIKPVDTPTALRPTTYYNADADGNVIPGTNAGIRFQDDLAPQIIELQRLEEVVKEAQEAYWRGGSKDAYEQAVADRDAQQTIVDGSKANVAQDAQKYANAKNAYDTAREALKSAEDAWKEGYSRNWADEHNGETDHKYVKVGKVMAWVDNYGEGIEAGTKQAARDTAYALLRDAKALLVVRPDHVYDYGDTPDEDATVAEIALWKKNVSKYWDGELKKANAALFEPLGVTKAEDIKDAEAKALYAAYEAIKLNLKAPAAKAKLVKLYKLWNPDYIADLDNDPDNNNNRYDQRFPENQDTQYGWLISSYHVDYEAQMVDFDKNEYVPIATKIFGYLKDKNGRYVRDENGHRVPNYTNSLAYQKELLEAFKEEVPEMIAEYKENNAKDLDKFTKDIQKLAKKIDAYKAHETNYLAWIESLNTAEVALNEALKAEFDAKQDYQEALAEYKAIYAVANEGMYVCWGLNETTGQPIWGWVNIAGAIEYFEDQNKTLENDIEDLKQLLKDGKVAFQLVNQMIDEWLVVLDERLEIWLAIANQYKVIMNGYLGIVEEVEAEPVVEGDEE